MAECTAAAATVRVAGEAGEPAAWSVGRSVGGAETIYGYLLQLFSFRACLAKKEEEGEEEERREGYNGSTIVRVSQWSTEEKKERERERELWCILEGAATKRAIAVQQQCVFSPSPLSSEAIKKKPNRRVHLHFP